MLTPKQQRFITEYLVDLNANQAAIRAGYSAKTAEVQGSRLLRNAQVQAAVQRRTAKQLAHVELTSQRVLEEYRRLAFSDVRKLFTPEGDLIPLHELSDDAAACIASIEIVMKNAAAGDGKVDRVLKIRQWDKTKALNDLARHFALLVDRVEVGIAEETLARLDAWKLQHRAEVEAAEAEVIAADVVTTRGGLVPGE